MITKYQIMEKCHFDYDSELGEPFSSKEEALKFIDSYLEKLKKRRDWDTMTPYKVFYIIEVYMWS